MMEKNTWIEQRNNIYRPLEIEKKSNNYLSKYLFLLFSLLLFECSDNAGRNGLLLNEKRLALGIPALEEEWVVHESDSLHELWGSKQLRIKVNSPVHFYKIIYFHHGSSNREDDVFHNETDGPMAYRLLVQNLFKEDKVDSTKYVLTVYNKDSTSSESSYKTEISKTKADSILMHWKITF